MIWWHWLVGIAEFIAAWWAMDRVLIRHKRKPARRPGVRTRRPGVRNLDESRRQMQELAASYVAVPTGTVVLPKGAEYTALPTGTGSTRVIAWGGEVVWARD